MKALAVLLLLMTVLCFPQPLTAQVTGLSGWNIYLDPGHSQRENMGIFGYSEAEKNLRVALALRDLLLQTTDIDTVYLSRTNDQVVVSLSQRTDEANRLGVAWYHSIHSDAGSASANSTLLLWGQYRDGREKIPNGGRAMSDHMVDLLTRGMRTTTRGAIGDCSFYGCNFTGPYLHVNRESAMPSELSEAGFHTNPAQNQRNMNAEWKKLEAWTFYWAILRFHGIPRPPAGICAGIITDLESGMPVNGAQVTLDGRTYTTDSHASLFYKYTSDPELLHNGFYFFEDVPIDTLALVVTAPGYFGDSTTVAMIDTFFTFKDLALVSSVAPRVIATTPASNDTNFAAWADLTLDFSRRMHPASVESALVIIPEAGRRFSWSSNNTRLRVRTDTLAFQTEYTLRLAGTARGLYGQLLDGNGDGVGGDDFVLHFRTGSPDMQPPALVSVYPLPRSSNVEVHPITNLVFDEALAAGSVTPAVFALERTSDQSPVAGTLKQYHAIAPQVLCFFPAQPLAPNESYRMRLLPGLRDAFGNTMTAEQNFNFKTTAETFTVTRIDDFETGLAGNWWAPQSSGSTSGIVTEITSREASSTVVNLITQSTTAMQLNYGWDPGAGSWLIRLYLGGGPPAQVLFDSNYLMQVYIFGDGSGNRFRFAVDDNYPVLSAANHEVSPWYTIDWTGWRLVTWDMSRDGTGSWIGDGRLDGTLRFDSIQLTYQSGKATAGTIYFDDLRVVKRSTVAVAETPAAVPEHLVLAQNFPNPFNPETTIRYHVPAGEQRVLLVIYDLMGQRVRTLVEGEQNPGWHQSVWDGRNDAGLPVASGPYLYHLAVGEISQTRRMVLLR